MRPRRSDADATASVVACREEDCASLDAFLSDRVYEFNSVATGCFDAELFGFAVLDDAGAALAGASGHTWAGCCQVTHLWVSESWRGRGVGGALLRAVESEAMRRGCSIVLLSTHDFQAPGFYDAHGYVCQAVIRDHPVGHSNSVYAKRLPAR